MDWKSLSPLKPGFVDAVSLYSLMKSLPHPSEVILETDAAFCSCVWIVGQFQVSEASDAPGITWLCYSPEDFTARCGSVRVSCSCFLLFLLVLHQHIMKMGANDQKSQSWFSEVEFCWQKPGLKSAKGNAFTSVNEYLRNDHFLQKKIF